MAGRGNGAGTAEEVTQAQTVDPNARTNIVFQGTNELVSILDRLAGEQDVSRGRLILNLVAAQVGYTLPEMPRKAKPKKYASDEERKAAQKKAADEKRALMKKVMSLVESGQLDIDLDALKAEIAAGSGASEGATEDEAVTA